MQYQISHDMRVIRWSKGEEEVCRFLMRPVEIDLTPDELACLIDNRCSIFISLAQSDVWESEIYVAPVPRKHGDFEITSGDEFPVGSSQANLLYLTF